MKEIWKSIPGYEGIYEASTLGNIKSLARTDRINHFRPDQLIGCRSKNGYRVACLTKNGRKKQHLIHSLVLLTFVGTPPSGMECCHKDGDKENCSLDNLRYDTHANNNRDRVIHKTIPKGEEFWKTKLTEVQVIEIAKKSERPSVLAKKYGVSDSTIVDIHKGRSWAWLTGLNNQ